ncbi:Aminotransferase family protein LolT [Aspergillus sclerotialis]|uniref:Aminotransferase family protein LolT n=1 Tax=Aspergillus sclerotialis TaxID=2070753 RepID=A0A3A2ZWS3_9EURO|nr:Aminotransferase family protein LolT [Aspergillus sclerotialis]
MSEVTRFGAPMQEYFLIDPSFKNLNHGSMGTYPAPVRTALRQFQDEVEARPDPFVRYVTPKLLDESREAVARLLNVPRRESVFVKNATTGVNTILRNVPFHSDDVIVYFETTYGAVQKGIMSCIESTPLQSRKVEYQCPISHDELLERFLEVVRTTRKEGLNVKVALFDVVSSMPAMRFPFEQISAERKEL